jgi:hypothetical protein
VPYQLERKAYAAIGKEYDSAKKYLLMPKVCQIFTGASNNTNPHIKHGIL